jgi:flagellar hook-associated protein 2
MTSTTSSVTGAVSSLGVGSGIDAASIISKLMAVESQPINDLKTAETGLKTQLSAFGQMQSLISTMQGKAQALMSPLLWTQTTPASSNASVVSATTNDSAGVGSYSVAVQALASSQTVTSTALPSSTSTLNEGSLTIQLGSWTGGPPATGFTAQSGKPPITISIGPGETSLQSIMQKINSSGAGVSATIINDANGARLSLSSSSTGAVNGFQITAAETVDDGDPATGLSALNFDATNTASPMQMNQQAANAKATVNGIQVESASNTLANVANGLTLNLQQVSATPVQISVTSNTGAVTTAVNDFVAAYNAIAKYITTETAYDASTKTSSPLQGDTTVLNLSWALRGVMNQPSTASSAFSVLSQVGITMQKDGTLAVDATKLTTAEGNLPELKKLFSANNDTNASSGFMTRFSNLASALLDVNGSLTTRQQGLQKSISDNEQRQSDMSLRVQQMQDNLTKQYQTLDTQMATMNALSTYLTQQYSSTNSVTKIA